MENSAGIQASLPGRYATALFDLASEEGSVSAVESDLEKLAAALSESDDLNALVTNPQISRTDAGKAIEGVAASLGLSDLTKKFVGTLAANRRLGSLGGMVRAFQTIAAAQRGEVTAQVTTAHPLSEDQLAKLKDKLTARQGRTVKIQTTVDPEILGGLVVNLGSEQIDSSIRTRLNSLSQAMKG